MNTNHDKTTVQLEIELEDYGSTSMLRRIATTLTGQYGTQSYRFVARPRADGPTDVDGLVSGTFAVLPLQLPLDDLDPRDATADDVVARWRDLQQDLEARGWEPTGSGSHWWSTIYTRPSHDIAPS